jgi:hypothetical protein
VTLLPNRFLFRLSVPCRKVLGVPLAAGDAWIDLPETCRIDDLSEMDDGSRFAEVRLAWNENGLALQLTVRGKEGKPEADVSRPASSDGLTLWLDTRDARTSHRAGRFCHQFHLLPTGGGEDGDEAVVVQTPIHRAQQDAPLAPPGSIPIRARATAAGYRLEAFLPASALNGFDPDQNRRLGIAYLVRDQELGSQSLGPSVDFPLGEDPSLWSVLELTDEPG